VGNSYVSYDLPVRDPHEYARKAQAFNGGFVISTTAFPAGIIDGFGVDGVDNIVEPDPRLTGYAFDATGIPAHGFLTPTVAIDLVDFHYLAWSSLGSATGNVTTSFLVPHEKVM
jgi:hypothetical protein